MVVNKVTPSLSGLISDVLRKSNAIKLPPHLSYRSIVEERLALLACASEICPNRQGGQNTMGWGFDIL
jgi:hypothetical protein